MATEFDIRRYGFEVRAAAESDARAVRMLLPKMSQSATCLLAIDRHQHLVIGAAAMTSSCRNQPLLGPGVAIEVIPPCRRHGVGTTLVAGLEHLARQAFAATALYSAQRVDQDSAALEGWQRLGFTPLDTVEEHVLPVDQFEPRLGPLIERMRATGRIPASATIVPLYRVNPAAVLQFHLDHLGGDRGELYRKLRGRGVGAFLPRHSRVLLVDDQIKGCLLAHRVTKQRVCIDANIVDPQLRGGWANVWLKLETLRAGRSLGAREFTFTTFDHYTDTRSFTSKLAGTTVRTTVLMVRSIQQHNSD